MAQAYSIIAAEGSAEIVEKKSHFLAVVTRIATEEEALSLLEAQRKRYFDASHHCSAYVLGANHELTRCSDDGEPSQTAGRPMLDVLVNAGLHDVCAIVTRYFGGTLLGTGGLVRAYSLAVKTALDHAIIVTKQHSFPVMLEANYSDAGKLRFIAESLALPITDTVYTEAVAMTVLTTEDTMHAFMKKATEVTCGRARFTELDPVWTYVQDGTLHYL